MPWPALIGRLFPGGLLREEVAFPFMGFRSCCWFVLDELVVSVALGNSGLPGPQVDHSKRQIPEQLLCHRRMRPVRVHKRLTLSTIRIHFFYQSWVTENIEVSGTLVECVRRCFGVISQSTEIRRYQQWKTSIKQNKRPRNEKGENETDDWRIRYTAAIRAVTDVSSGAVALV